MAICRVLILLVLNSFCRGQDLSNDWHPEFSHYDEDSYCECPNDPFSIKILKGNNSKNGHKDKKKNRFYERNQGKNETKVDCTRRGLDSIPHLCSRVESLDLSKNNISDITLSDMMYFTRLKTLTMIENDIKLISENAFEDNIALTSIKLSHNKIPDITSGMFNLKKLEVLHLSYNNINDIETGAFSNCLDLHYLDLSHNQLMELQPQTFLGGAMNTLRELKLKFNHLKKVPTEALSILSKLSSLDLSGNRISYLRAERGSSPFQGLDSLDELILSKCEIHEIDATAFEGLSNLRLLDISFNGLSSTPNEAFRPLNELEELHIGGNKISRITEEDYRFLPLLTKLVVNTCPQDVDFMLHQGMLKQNSYIAVLNITRCLGLKKIDEELNLSFLVNLKHVSFHGSPLENLPKDLFAYDELESLDVSHCPLSCCALTWMKNYHLSLNIDELSCITPSEESLTLEEFLENELDDCPSEWDDEDNQELYMWIGIGAGIAVFVILVIVGCLMLKRWRRTGYWNPCRKEPRRKRKRLSHSFTGKDDIQVILNEIKPEARDSFIPIKNVRNKQDRSDEVYANVQDHIYQEIPFSEQTERMLPCENFPDVKRTVI